MKICSRCKINKSFDNFYKNKARKDGLAHECKECCKTVFIKILQCGTCNQPFEINHRNISKRKKFLCKKCTYETRVEKIIQTNKNKNKAQLLSSKGYEYVTEPSAKHGYIFGHRKVMELFLGRSLTKTEVVHHIDNNKLNNKIENLWFTDSVGHKKAHQQLIQLAFELVEKEIIIFDKKMGKYQFKD